MNVVVLKLYIPEENENVKAYADVLLGHKIRIHGLKLATRTDNGEFFLGMPSKKHKDKDEYSDVCEIIDHDFRAKVLKTIQEAYNARISPGPPCAI